MQQGRALILKDVHRTPNTVLTLLVSIVKKCKLTNLGFKLYLVKQVRTLGVAQTRRLILTFVHVLGLS